MEAPVDDTSPVIRIAAKERKKRIDKYSSGSDDGFSDR
jgi:hypothetical protein